MRKQNFVRVGLVVSAAIKFCEFCNGTVSSTAWTYAKVQSRTTYLTSFLHHFVPLFVKVFFAVFSGMNVKRKKTHLA